MRKQLCSATATAAAMGVEAGVGGLNSSGSSCLSPERLQVSLGEIPHCVCVCGESELRASNRNFLGTPAGAFVTWSPESYILRNTPSCCPPSSSTTPFTPTPAPPMLLAHPGTSSITVPEALFGKRKGEGFSDGAPLKPLQVLAPAAGDLGGGGAGGRGPGRQGRGLLGGCRA